MGYVPIFYKKEKSSVPFSQKEGEGFFFCPQLKERDGFCSYLAEGKRWALFLSPAGEGEEFCSCLSEGRSRVAFLPPGKKGEVLIRSHVKKFCSRFL